MALYRLILTRLPPASQRALADAISTGLEQIKTVEVFSSPDLSQAPTDLYHAIAEDNRFEKIRDLQLLLEKLGCEACVVDETSSFKRAKDHGRSLIRFGDAVWKELRELLFEKKLWKPGPILSRLGRVPGWVWLVVGLSCLTLFTIALEGSSPDEQPDHTEAQPPSAVAEFWLDVAEQ